MNRRYKVPLLVIQSTDTMKDEEVDAARRGVICTLAKWCMPQCSVLGSVELIPTWVLRRYLVTACGNCLVHVLVRTLT